MPSKDEIQICFLLLLNGWEKDKLSIVRSVSINNGIALWHKLSYDIRYFPLGKLQLSKGIPLKLMKRRKETFQISKDDLEYVSTKNNGNFFNSYLYIYRR